MKTKTICIAAASLYESKGFHKVRCYATGKDYLLTKWGSFLITSADNHFVQGTRVSSGSAS
jgi:hypothetical protein